MIFKGISVLQYCNVDCYNLLQFKLNYPGCQQSYSQIHQSVSPLDADDRDGYTREPAKMQGQAASASAVARDCRAKLGYIKLDGSYHIIPKGDTSNYLIL